MSQDQQQPNFGPYRLVRPLRPSPIADRWLALHEKEQTSHVVHELCYRHDKSAQRRFLSAVENLAELDHPHLLPIERFSLGAGGHAYAITPYTGNPDGLVTLETLLKDKGGQMAPAEVDEALTQILEACQYAHERGHVHGPHVLEQILVDRKGSVWLEMYALPRRLQGLAPGNAELIRDEIRSIAEIGYQLMTGLAADEPRISAGRLVKKLDRRWDEWLDEGLEPSGGFATAEQALSALPSNRKEADLQANAGPVRIVIRRVRSAFRTPT